MEENERAPDNCGKRIWKKDILLIIYALLTVGAVILAIRTVIVKSKGTPAGNVQASQQIEKLTDSISFPQFEWIDLKADKTKQKISFYNPTENFVKFRISIILDDEVLWESELLQPGERSKPVVLSKALPEGEYEGRLVYHSFGDDEEKNPLSGADSPTILKVK